MKPFAIRERFIPRGKVSIPGDKSIAHRALIISALSRGRTVIKNFPVHDDSLATIKVLSGLGVVITRKDNQVTVRGTGKLKEPKRALFVGNSGTTMRLMAGVLAGSGFKAKLTAGKYLSKRPMSRVNIPLRLMGARISARRKGAEEYAPLAIEGGCLRGITYRPPVASAQVKSAVLLAALSAAGKTRVIEKVPTRDHTERMLKFFGARLSVSKGSVLLNPAGKLSGPGVINIPGDISSAAFFMVLGSIIPGARIIMEGVSLNPGRTGIIKVLKRMGAKIKVSPCKKDSGTKGFEPAGDICVSAAGLKGTLISRRQIPSLIDELPVIMVAACFAKGRTVIRGAGELRFKETDRIDSISANLKAMSADIRVSGSGGSEDIIINGKGSLWGAGLRSFADHRTAMSMVVAALGAKGSSTLDDISCVNKSFPGFFTCLNSLFR